MDIQYLNGNLSIRVGFIKNKNTGIKNMILVFFFYVKYKVYKFTFYLSFNYKKFVEYMNFFLTFRF